MTEYLTKEERARILAVIREVHSAMMDRVNAALTGAEDSELFMAADELRDFLGDIDIDTDAASYWGE